MTRALRSHQQTLAGIVAAIATCQTDATTILASVTPGGGKSLMPVIAAARLMAAGMIDRICLVVPRDSLRLQAEEAFADSGWRETLGHSLTIRAADNSGNPSRGLAGYVTTYQGIAAAPDLHLAELRRYRTLLVLDEVHHLPSCSEVDPVAAELGVTTPEDEQQGAWSRALLPMLECAEIRLLLSGTLERADGRGILWLPYRTGKKSGVREVDLNADGWAVIGYSRAQALAERAVLPVTFGALDGEATWRDEDGVDVGPHRLQSLYRAETTRPALFTALRTGFAEALLRESFVALKRVRAERRKALGPQGGEPTHSLGKLLIVAPDQATATRYLKVVRGWIPERHASEVAQMATSSSPRAQETLAAFRLRPEPSILSTVAMAHEGMDCPAVCVVAALTHVRSRAWLEQMVARATRVDPRAGPYETQQALVFHPDDPLFATFRKRMETEQGTTARKPRERKGQCVLPLWLRDQIGSDKPGITPLESNALALRYQTLAPGPELALRRPEHEEAQQELIEPPSVTERRLRTRLGMMVANQAVEADAGRRSAPTGQSLYHAFNAVLKRSTGNKSRGEMTLGELAAAVGWLERNRLVDHLHVLKDDTRYQWAARRRGDQGPPATRRRASQEQGSQG